MSDGLLARLARTSAKRLFTDKQFRELVRLDSVANADLPQVKDFLEAEALAFGRELCAELAREQDELAVEARNRGGLVEWGTRDDVATRIRKIAEGED